MERKHFALKEYEKGEMLKIQGDHMENKEKERIEGEMQEKLEREEVKMRNKQQANLNTLLKRI